MIFKRDKKIVDTIAAYQSVFSTPEGERVLYDLIKSCHILHSTMDPNPNEMAYKEGERSVVLRILQTLGQDPAALIKRIEEGRKMEEQYVE